MRNDRCRFCRSRKCYDRVVTSADPLRFDEVACRRHAAHLYAFADAELGKDNGVMRWYISGTGLKARGEPLPT